MSNQRTILDPHCPFCAQQVSIAARICPFCRSDLANNAVFRQRVTRNHNWGLVLLTLIGYCILIGFLMHSCSR